MSDKYNRSLSIAVIGNAISQVLPILALPLLARQYSVNEFGTFNFYLSIISILVVASSAKFDAAVSTAENDSDFLSLLIISLALSFIFSVFIFFVNPVFFDKSLDITANNLLISLGVLSAAILQVMSNSLIYLNSIRIQTESKMIRSTVQALFQLGFGFFKWSSIGLLIGAILSNIATVIYIFKRQKYSISKVPRPYVIKVFYKYLNYPAYILPSSLISSVALNIPVIYISHAYTTQESGLYGMAARVLTLPSMIVTQAIGQTFLAKIMNNKRDGIDQKYTILNTYLILLGIGTAFAIVLLPSGGLIFKFFLGPEWEMSGKIASILTFWISINLISSPLSGLVFVINKQKSSLKITISEFITRLLSLYIGHYISGFYGAILAYSASGFVISTIYIFWILKMVKIDISYWLKHLLISILLIAISVCIINQFNNLFLRLIISGICLVAVGLIFLKFKRETK